MDRLRWAKEAFNEAANEIRSRGYRRPTIAPKDVIAVMLAFGKAMARRDAPVANTFLMDYPILNLFAKVAFRCVNLSHADS